MTTVGILSFGGGGKGICHLIDSTGARTYCGSFSAWGTSFYSERDPEVKFIDIERGEVNGKLCGRCLMALGGVEYERSCSDPGSGPIGHMVDNMDELTTLLNKNN